jgi:hypothetical protein
MSFLGRPMPCKLPTVGRCELQPLALGRVLSPLFNADTGMQDSGTADIAFEHQRHSSKSRLLKMSGRESIRRKEISDILDTNSATSIGTAFCLLFVGP